MNARGFLAPALLVLAVASAVPRDAAAQPSQARTILVAEGGSYDVSVHPDFVTVIYLPDAIEKAIASDPAGYEVKPIGATSLAIRPLSRDAKPANLALVTATVKVSVVLRIVASRDDAMTQVTFKRADLEAEMRRHVDEAVRERTAALEARIADIQRAMDIALPALAEEMIITRLLRRYVHRAQRAIERNDEHVVIEALEAVTIGDDTYLLFAIENRGRAPFRVTRVELRDHTRNRGAGARVAGDAAEAPGPGVLGVIRGGGNGRGVVVVRRTAAARLGSLTLVVDGTGGRVTLDGIALP